MHLHSSPDVCDQSSALARAGSQAVSDSRFMLEAVLSAALWCGCGLNRGLLFVGLLWLQSCSRGGHEEKNKQGLICSLWFSIPHSTVAVVHVEDAAFLGPSQNPSLAGYCCLTSHFVW